MRWIFLFFIFFTSSFSYSKTLIIQSSESSYELKNYFEYYHDESAALSIEDIGSPTFEKKFSQLPPWGGLYKGAIWAKLNIRNNSLDSKFISEYKWIIGDLRYYIQTGNNTFLSEKSGIVNPPQKRKNSSVLLPMDLPIDKEVRVYFRFEYSDPINFNVILFTENEFDNVDHIRQIVYGLYIGIMFILILLNIFLFFAFREIKFLYYCGSLIFTHIFGGIPLCFGLLTEYVFSFSTLEKFGLPNLFGSSMIFFNLLFSSAFLETKMKAPKVHSLSDILTVLSAILMILSVVYPYDLAVSTAVNYSIMGVNFYILIVALFLTFKKDLRAFLFLLSWFALISSGIVLTLCIQGLIPDNFVTRNCVFLGSWIEAIMISLLLALQVRQILRDRVRLKFENLNTKIDLAEATNKIMNDHLHKIKSYLYRIYYLFDSKKSNLASGDTAAIQLIDEAFLDTIKNSREDLSRRFSEEGNLTGSIVEITYYRIAADYLKEGISFVYRCKEKNQVIAMTHQDFYCILDILISNAANSVEKSIEKNIQLSIDVDSKDLIVTVSDTGKGFPKTDSLSKFGTGFGLRRVTEILEKYNSKLEINSTEGKGSKVAFRISL